MSLIDTAITYAIEHPTTTGLVILGVGLSAYIIHVSSPPLSMTPSLPGPRGWPLVGSFFSRGRDPAETYRLWSKIYGPVFKDRLGSTYVVVINGANEADELLADPKYAAATMSRSISWSGAKILHADPRSLTLGWSPINDNVKKLRTVALRTSDASKLSRYQPNLDWCAKHMIREMWTESQANGGVVDPVPIMRRTGQNMSIGVQFGVGTKVAQETYSPKNLKASMRALDHFRSVHGRIHDYLPWLQLPWIPEQKIFKDALIASRGRNDGLDRLVTAAREAHAIGELKDCAIKVMLDDAKVELSHNELSLLSSSMISAGIDWHMPNSLLWALAAVAKDPQVQRAAHESVLHKNSDPNIKVPNAVHGHEDYVMAIVKEVGRYYDVFRIAPTRSTVEDIVWRGHFIPSGTTILLNSHAVNRDETRFTDPMTFNPSRYLTSSGLPEATRSLPNYTFSLGRRSCPAMLLAHKEMHNIISTLVQWFEIELHDGEMKFDPVEANDSPYQFNQGPKQFRVRIRARDQAKLEEWLSTGDGDEVEEVSD